MNAAEARAFYDEQLAFYACKDIAGLVEAHYATDAQFVTFDNACRGKDEIRAFLEAYLERLGFLEAELHRFRSTDDLLYFEVSIRSGAGTWRAYDCMVLKGTLITHHVAGIIAS